MNVSLTPELEQFAHELVESGKFLSASEVVCEGLRLLQDRYLIYQGRLAQLQKEVNIGVEQLEQGKRVDGREVIKRLHEKNCQTEQAQQ